MNKNFEDKAKKYKEEMLKLYQQQQKTKSNNKEANIKNQKNNNNMKNNGNKNAKPMQNNQPNMNEQPPITEPVKPLCPATQPIEPFIPTNISFNDNLNTNVDNNRKFSQWDKVPSDKDKLPSPPSPFMSVIPSQVNPDLIPISPEYSISNQSQVLDIPQTELEVDNLRTIFEQTFPEPILPPFPRGETGAEFVPPEEIEDGGLPADIDTGKGELTVITRTASNAFPVKDAIIIIERVYPDGTTEVISSLITNSSGVSPTISLSAPPKKYSLIRQSKVLPFAHYDILVSAPGYYKMIYKNVPIFDEVQSIQPVDMIPVSLDISTTDRIVRYVESDA